MDEQRLAGAATAAQPPLATPVSGAVARAYDRIAASYDGAVAGDRWMRVVLWGHYARAFQAGDRVLDVSCGTGQDAAVLAGRGVHVTGIDVSARMIDAFRGRARHEGLEHLMEARVLDAGDLSALDAGSFDGLVSAFAGLSTLPDLNAFAADAARVLRPGGRAVVHLLNRFSLWEWLVLVRRGRWADARVLGRRAERDFSIGGEAVRHYLHAPLAAYGCFAPHFTLVGARGLGAVCPPPSLERVPGRLRRGLEWLDPRLGAHPPCRDWGRFFVLDLAIRPGVEAAGDGP